jgi:hypothetical protein
MIYRSRVPLIGLAVSQAADGKVFEKVVQFPTGSGSRQVLEAPGRFHKCATLTTTYGSPTSFVWLGDLDAGACLTDTSREAAVPSGTVFDFAFAARAGCFTKDDLLECVRRQGIVRAMHFSQEEEEGRTWARIKPPTPMSQSEI